MSIQLQLKINPEYQKLVPEMSKQDFETLKLDIKEKGQLFPITVTSQGVILDGHHRYRACQELGIKCIFVLKDFENELQEKLFVIDSNLKRRHLNSFQRTELALKAMPILEEIAKRNSEANLKQNNNHNKNNNHSHSPSVPNGTVGIGRVDQEIGRRAGVGKNTVRRVELIIQKAPHELLDKARKGQFTINKLYKKLQNEQKRHDLISATPIIQLPDNVKLIQGDFREATKEIPDNSIDLIFTDPPYDGDSLPLYKDLGIMAARVLKESGSLVTIAGHYALIKIGNYVEESGLKYIHEVSLVHSGDSAKLHVYDIRVKHKPILWFVKGKSPSIHNIIEDVIFSTPPKKSST